MLLAMCGPTTSCIATATGPEDAAIVLVLERGAVCTALKRMIKAKQREVAKLDPLDGEKKTPHWLSGRQKRIKAQVKHVEIFMGIRTERKRMRMADNRSRAAWVERKEQEANELRLMMRE